MSKIKILDINIDLLNKEDVLQEIENRLDDNSNKVFCISTLNIELIMRAQKCQDFKYFLNKISNLNTIDGVGILNVMKWYGLTGYERVCGSDLAYDLARICQQKNKKYFILGASENVSKTAKETLKNMYSGLKVENYSPEYVQTLNFSESENLKIKNKISEFKPNVICVAFGAVKQELWIKNNLQFLQDSGVQIAIGLGGSFDFIAGKIKRAPEIFKKTGNEWLYRLIKEPKSRFKRQISTIPIYYLLCFIEYMRRNN